METIPIDNLKLYFDEEDREAAELIRQACEKSVRIIHESWGLETPTDCRLHVMTSGMRFIFQSAPWHWVILLCAFMPLIYLRVKKIWDVSSGWAQQYGKRRAIGIKPPRLLEMGDRSMGDQVFVRDNNVRNEVRRITCHELVHAFTSHLRLPMWLNEGLAMVTVDKFEGKPTVKQETLAFLKPASENIDPGRYRKLSTSKREALIYHFVRGYWITRYIADMQPGLLQNSLKNRQKKISLENSIAEAFQKNRETFWKQIDDILTSHFK